MLPKILRRPAVEELTGLSRSAIYEGMAAGTFPKSIKRSARGVGWLEPEVIDWIKKRVADRDYKGKRRGRT